MLKILIASEDAERLAEISRLTAACGHVQLMRHQDSPASLVMQANRLRSANALIIDQGSSGAAQMHSVESLREQHPDLPCILVTSVPHPDLLLRALRTGVRDVLAWPLDKAQLHSALSRLEANHVLQAENATRIVSFISCKGGTGTSFVASNLGYVLSAQEGKRVLLIDLNNQFSDTSYLVSDKTPPSTLPEVCSQIERVDDAFLEACLTRVHDGFDILAGASDPIKAGEIRKEQLEYIISVASPRYDFILFDIGQSVNPLSIAALDRSDRICVLVQPSIAYARTGRRLLDILHALHYGNEKIRIVVNRHGRRDELPRATLENVFGMKIFHMLPDDPAVADQAISHGVPVTKEHKRSAIARALLSLGTALTDAPGERRAQAADTSPLRRLFLRAKPTPANIA
ncbi:AAA family ATPase [Cupriavidus basilensis]